MESAAGKRALQGSKEPADEGGPSEMSPRRPLVHTGTPSGTGMTSVAWSMLSLRVSSSIHIDFFLRSWCAMLV